MKIRTPSLFSVYLFVVFCVAVGYAIECYICNSHKKGEEDCEDITSKKYLHNCSDEKHGSKYNGCWKMEQWVDFKMLEMPPDHRIIRQCAYMKEDSSRSCYYKAGFGGRINVCHCEIDGCNGARAVSPGRFGTALSVLAILWLLH